MILSIFIEYDEDKKSLYIMEESSSGCKYHDVEIGEVPDYVRDYVMDYLMILMNNDMKFKKLMESSSEFFSIPLEWEKCKYGYERAKFSFDNYTELEKVRNYLYKADSFSIDTWTNSDGGVFEGYLFVMDRKNFQELQSKLEEDKRINEDWWNRYHFADLETKALMACGAIK